MAGPGDRSGGVGARRESAPTRADATVAQAPAGLAAVAPPRAEQAVVRATKGEGVCR